MKARIFYVKLTDEMYDEINSAKGDGWSTPAGKQYLTARHGKAEDLRADMFEEVTDMDVSNAEDAWVALQNITAEGNGIDNRSMDVGDLVVWEDGRIERVAACGFDTVDGLEL